MSIVVQKFGGSSVATADSIKRVAARIARYHRAGHQVVVVVSAMGDTTDDLLELALRVTDDPPARELDMLLTAGERMSMSLLAMALTDLGVQAQSFTGSQAGMITDESYGSAKIIDVTPGRIATALDDGNVAIVAGFQGVSQDSKNITTLGRGGSDTTAVALAAGLDADVCEIYTDVDGVFTADPRKVPAAKRVPVINPEEMLELAAHGAKVLMLRCVEYARRFDVPLHVRSSFSEKIGTIVVADDHERVFPIDPTRTSEELARREDPTVEQPLITGVTHDRTQGKITVVGVPDVPGRAALVFDAVAEADANIDMIVQNTSVSDENTAISFTLPETDAAAVQSNLWERQQGIGFQKLIYEPKIGIVSLVGAAMRTHPGVSAHYFRSLADNDINVTLISTSEIRISACVPVEQLEDAIRVLHSAFGLDTADGEAVVYGGTGR